MNEKTQALVKLHDKINSPQVIQRLEGVIKVQGNVEGSELAARAIASSVYAEVKKTVGDQRRDLTVCTPDSICQAMIDATEMRLPIDGRQLAHLLKRGNQCQLQIGYRGFLHRVAQLLDNFDCTAVPVFEGESVTIFDKNGFQGYEKTAADALGVSRTWENLRGMIMHATYSKDKKDYSKVEVIDKEELIKIRKCAKTDAIWAQWPIEKAKAAGFKRICKPLLYSSLDNKKAKEVQDLIDYDNRSYDLTKLDRNKDSFAGKINREVQEREKVVQETEAEIINIDNRSKDD